MSESERSSHAKAWSWPAGLGAALLLYVLSCGPVKAYYRIPHDVGSITLFLDGSPGWLKKFYIPVDKLREIGFVERSLDAYFAWCDRMMH